MSQVVRITIITWQLEFPSFRILSARVSSKHIIGISHSRVGRGMSVCQHVSMHMEYSIVAPFSICYMTTTSDMASKHEVRH